MYKLTGVTKPGQKRRRTHTQTTPPSDIRRRCWSWQSVNRNDDDMNHDTGGRPGRLRRAGLRPMSVLAAALAGVALLAAACGGGTAPATTPPASHGVTNSTDNAQGVAYTQCMRKDGVPNFPDPNSQGNLFNGAYLKQAGVDPDSPQAQAASSACSHLLPAGVTTPAQQQPRTCSNGVCRRGSPPAQPKVIKN
jgi:hypothetical protein